MKNSGIKLIIFDFNGVLAYGNYHTLANWLAKKYHRKEKEIYRILYHKWFNQAAEGKITEKYFFEQAFKELGFPLNWKVARKKYMDAVIPNKPLINYLVKLQGEGFKILILSKNVPSQFNEGIKNCGIKKHFKNVVNTFNLNLPKASKETMLYILKKYKVRPKEVIFVDDQDFNLTEAAKLGINTTVYKNLAQLKKRFKNLLRSNRHE